MAGCTCSTKYPELNLPNLVLASEAEFCPCSFGQVRTSFSNVSPIWAGDGMGCLSLKSESFYVCKMWLTFFSISFYKHRMFINKECQFPSSDLTGQSSSGLEKCRVYTEN